MNVTNVINFLLTLTFFCALPAFAASTEGDLSINTAAIRFGNESIVEGQPVRIYATISNLGEKDLLGTVRFYDSTTNAQIDSDQPISVIAGKSDDVFVDWIPAYGSSEIKVSVDPWNSTDDDTNNNSASIPVSVEKDTDRDGIGNSKDSDDDNDGVSDSKDMFPLDSAENADTDHDDIGNNKDQDDDNDTMPDTEDALPLDASESLDTDRDGIGNNADLDDDNDTISDTDETRATTDPLKTDTDNDGTPDNEDALPTDPLETKDTDRDGIGNNKDPDDDNDGLADSEDPNDENKGPVILTTEIPANISMRKTLEISAEKSSDADGHITSFEWKIDGKKAENGPTLSLNFPETGRHTITLIATDNLGESRTKTFKIRVVNYEKYALSALILILLAILGSFYYSKRRILRRSPRPKQSPPVILDRKGGRLRRPTASDRGSHSEETTTKQSP